MNKHFILVQGVKGGCGATTVSANLAAAFNKQGAYVVVLDITPQNDLRLHFGMDFNDQNGLFKNLSTQESIASAYQSNSGSTFFPFGELATDEAANVIQKMATKPFFIDEIINNIEFNFASNQDVIIIVSAEYHFAALIKQSIESVACEVLVALTDGASFAQLVKRQYEFDYEKSILLLNQFLPSFTLAKDMQLLMIDRWQQIGPNRIKTLFRDEFVAEALAQNSNVVDYAGQSKSAKDYHLLALQIAQNFWLEHK